MFSDRGLTGFVYGRDPRTDVRAQFASVGATAILIAATAVATCLEVAWGREWAVRASTQSLLDSLSSALDKLKPDQ